MLICFFFFFNIPLTPEEYKQQMENITETVTVIKGNDEEIPDNGVDYERVKVSLILMELNSVTTVDISLTSNIDSLTAVQDTPHENRDHHDIANLYDTLNKA